MQVQGGSSLESKESAVQGRGCADLVVADGKDEGCADGLGLEEFGRKLILDQAVLVLELGRNVHDGLRRLRGGGMRRCEWRRVGVAKGGVGCSVGAGMQGCHIRTG